MLKQLIPYSKEYNEIIMNQFDWMEKNGYPKVMYVYDLPWDYFFPPRLRKQIRANYQSYLNLYFFLKS
jgi:hypothetical protein